MDTTIWKEFGVMTLFVWAIFFAGFIRDRSRYRNCLILFVALLFTLEELFLLESDRAFTLTVMFLLLIVLLVPEFLIYNGIVTIRREGANKAHLLSLFLGIAILLGELTAIFAFIDLFFMDGITGDPRMERILIAILLAVSLTVIYGSLSFLMYMLYSIFLMIIPRKRDFDYVIIHGAGLTDGLTPSKLLADRIDKAIKIYHEDPTPPILIPSGGQGSDEKVSEAEAMKRYLVEKGIPEDHIIKEDQSATTYENLVNSKKIIDEREGRKYTALVTSNYHVYRCLRYCKKVGLNCTGIGSHVAFYYYPSALIREYIAVHAEKKHAIIFFLGWLIFMIPVFIYIRTI